MKNKSIYLKIVIIILIIINTICLLVFTKKKNLTITPCYLESDSNFILVEKNELDNLTSYLYKDNEDHFLSKLYIEDKEEVFITDLIKKDKIDEYNNKIQELLFLKYPKFIVESLIKEETSKSYILRDNEMVIYFNNYEINPSVDELLYLKVNYNEIKDFIEFTVLLDSSYENESGYNYNNFKKSVAFTFDDSPNKNKTNKILESLKDNLFHATFFIVGQRARNNKDLLLNIKSDGNEIGSHTYSHQNMKTMTNEEFINDFNIMNDLYKSIFNENLKLIRPPYGSINSEQASLINTSFILWNKDTNDWRYRNKNHIINYVLDNIDDGDIFLFHDSYDSTVEAINELLPLLYSKGYQVMSVSELFALKGIDLKANLIYHDAKK